MNFAAVILAGGKSSRMGRDKAFVEMGGQTLLARQIQLAREVGAADIFISGRVGVDYSKFGARVLLDEVADAGPLAGIARALAETSAPLLLVLAVDLPEMSVEFLRRLAAHCTETVGAIPRVAGQVEPLVAFYPSKLKLELQQAGAAASAKSFAARSVEISLARYADFSADDAKFFTNWNSPTDFSPARFQ
jgi:molybdopterin-guanine dinucleotide biosynthesis protein A